MTTRKRTTTKASQAKATQEAEAKAQQPKAEDQAKATQEAEAKAAQGEDAKNTEVATQDPAKEPAAKDGPIQEPPTAPQDEIPALFIRTKRRYKSRRRAGHRFSREGYAIALAALSEGQIEQLKADPALEVEECSFPADPDDDPES